jgi:hypothetical protein
VTVAAIYLERKLAGLCVYHRCGTPPADGAQLCLHHLAKQRKRDAKYKAKLRARRRESGLCAFCLAKSKTYRCLACLVKAGFAARRKSVPCSVDKSARIAARTVMHHDGRTRYHGQNRRGQQPRAQLDDQDLAEAISRLQRAKDGLAAARSPEAQLLPRIQREDAERAALAQLELAGRFLDDVGERNSRLNGPVRIPASVRR